MDKPSPNWPTWISLNTIVAIYVVILKASILLVTAEGIGQLKWSWFSRDVRPLEDLVKFDDATRGPYGAGVLLWRLRTDHLLSSLGAIIIILGLVSLNAHPPKVYVLKVIRGALRANSIHRQQTHSHSKLSITRIVPLTQPDHLTSRGPMFSVHQASLPNIRPYM
jgi:hypothetical protein